MADRNQESASDHTGAAPEREAAKVPGRGALIPQPHGGALLPGNRPGSNGGVHRGPDRYPRVTQGMAMRAMMRPGKLLVVDAKGRLRSSRKLVEAAMVENIVTRMAEIPRRGSNQDVLRLLELFTRIFPLPPKNGNGHAPAAPTPPNFVRPAAVAPETPDESAPEADGGLTHNGEEYA